MAAPDPFLDLARSRRTAREHTPASVPDAATDAVLEAARWAPSAANRQPWEFVVVRDAGLKAALRQAFLAEAAEHGAKYRSVTEKQADLLLAPGLILVCGDPGTKVRYINADEIGDAVLEELFLLSLAQVSGHIGVDEARSDAIDSDIAAAHFPRQGFAKPDYSGFGGGIIALSGIPHAAYHRSDIDDSAVTRFHHGAQHQLAEPVYRLQVGGHDVVPFLVFHAQQ